MSTATNSQYRSGFSSYSCRSGYVDLLQLGQLNPERYPFLLQSVASAPALARYDILFACPGESISLADYGEPSGPEDYLADTFLASLDRWFASEQLDSVAPDDALEHLPFTGGWFLYLGYELAGEVEPGLKLDIDPTLPIAFATRVSAAIIYDREQQNVIALTEPSQSHLLDTLLADLDALPAKESAPVIPEIQGQLREDNPEQFRHAVARAQAYIRAGDIFQANLARRWQGELQADVQPADVYARLRETNPAPFAGLIQSATFALVSSSPERLVRRVGATLDTRPIAGTRPRAASPDMLAEHRQELLDHPKERAEHIMLIDLERNDLGRVCVGGSVHVNENMVVESYSHVHHIVSNVTGQAKAGLTPGELIRAVFPGGTITGCPKVRCMEIISELEGIPRGAYTGSMGYLNLNGDCDLNILIRTLVMRGSRVELAAGCGIVADSDPEAELEESRAKAKGMLLALGEQGADSE